MLASSIVLGAAAGMAFGGRWDQVRRLRIAWLPVAILAVVLRVGGIIFPLPLAAYLVAIVLIGVVALRNFRIEGVALIGMGSLLNALVIAINGGMPVDPSAAEAAAAAPVLNDRLHVALGPDTRLHWLSDVLPLQIFRNVYSVGDVLIAAGGFWVPFALLRRK